MTGGLTRSDLDQAARHFAHAREQLADMSFLSKATALNLLDVVIARLSPGDRVRREDDLAADITVLTEVARKMPGGAARVSVLKGVAVLRDKGNGSRY